MPAKIGREQNPETLKIIQRIDAELERVRPLLRENERIILKMTYKTACDIEEGLSVILTNTTETLKIRFNCEVVIVADGTLGDKEFEVAPEIN